MNLPPEGMVRTAAIQIVCDGTDGNCDTIYPDPDPARLPSYAFLSSPGMMSYCETLDAAVSRRVGSNPLVVNCTAMHKTPDGRPQLVISAEDAEKVRKADADSLLTITWRVAVVGKFLSDQSGGVSQ